jgi:hypothetical protein
VTCDCRAMPMCSLMLWQLCVFIAHVREYNCTKAQTQYRLLSSIHPLVNRHYTIISLARKPWVLTTRNRTKPRYWGNVHAPAHDACVNACHDQRPKMGKAEAPRASSGLRDAARVLTRIQKWVSSRHFGVGWISPAEGDALDH